MVGSAAASLPLLTMNMTCAATVLFLIRLVGSVLDNANDNKQTTTAFALCQLLRRRRHGLLFL